MQNVATVLYSVLPPLCYLASLVFSAISLLYLFRTITMQEYEAINPEHFRQTEMLEETKERFSAAIIRPYDFLKELDAFDRGQPTPIKQSEGSSDNEHRVSTYSLKTGGKHSLPYKVYTENANSHSPKKENNDDKDDK